MVADVIAAVASHRPGHGRSGPVSQPRPGHRLRRETLARLEADADGDHRPLPAGAVGAAAAAAPRAVGGGLRQPARHRVLRRRCSASPPPRSRRSRRSTRSTSAARTASTHVGVCTNTLCAVMGGDQIFADAQGAPRRRPRRDDRRRQRHPRAPRVQRGLRLRAGDDGQLGVLRQPDARSRPRGSSTACAPATCRPRPAAPRCARSSRSPGCSPASTTAAPDEGPAAGPATLAGLEIYREQQEAEREGKHSASKSGTTQKDGDA